MKNLRCYYNFFNDQNFVFRSSILSKHDKSIIVKFKDIYDYKETDIDIGQEKLIVKEMIDFTYLLGKTKIIKSLLNQTKRTEHKNFNLIENYCLLKNSKCNNCKLSMNFTITQLNDNFRKITINDLKNELKKHKHPMSRKINKRAANKEQKRDELIQHYKKVHGV